MFATNLINISLKKKTTRRVATCVSDNTVYIFQFTEPVYIAIELLIY